jgi:hypothetical protein
VRYLVGWVDSRSNHACAAIEFVAAQGKRAGEDTLVSVISD